MEQTENTGNLVVIMDEDAVAVMLSAFLALKATLHSDNEKVLEALHCDKARASMLTAAGILVDMDLLGDDAQWQSIMMDFCGPALAWFAKVRPEVVVNMAAKVTDDACEQTEMEVIAAPPGSEGIN